MSDRGPNSPLRILHVLTLNSRNGDYGGPLRVARELCGELNRRGHYSELFSGAIRNLEPSVIADQPESFVIVNQLSKRFTLSTLWSWEIIGALKKRIRSSDIVHIHFARELIPITAALICIFFHKKFVTQTHGMIIDDNRMLIRLVDFFFIVPIWKRASLNYVLTENELARVSKIYLNPRTAILPNGIEIKSQMYFKEPGNPRIVVFCARLHESKGVDKFISLAESLQASNHEFRIYGPDGGELDRVLTYIKGKDSRVNISYNGSLAPTEVTKELSKFDLVVLPSSYDPFPMLILEALSVGTPVLVMPSCGFASTLADFNENFVAESESFDGLLATFGRLMETLPMTGGRNAVDFCERFFSIESVCNSLLDGYHMILEKDEH